MCRLLCASQMWAKCGPNVGLSTTLVWCRKSQRSSIARTRRTRLRRLQEQEASYRWCVLLSSASKACGVRGRSGQIMRLVRTSHRTTPDVATFAPGSAQQLCHSDSAALVMYVRRVQKLHWGAAAVHKPLLKVHSFLHWSQLYHSAVRLCESQCDSAQSMADEPAVGSVGRLPSSCALPACS